MACRRFRSWRVIAAIVALSVVASVPMARAAPPANGGTASGVVVPQSANCSVGGQQDAHCLPGGPGSPARPSGPIHPPVPPPVTPPGTLPITPLAPPPGIPPKELPNFIWGRAKATLHIHDDDQDVTYTSSDVPLAFFKSHDQDMPGNTQYLLFPKNLSPAPGEEGLLWMTWTVTGRVFDCTVDGTAIVTLPAEPDSYRGPGGGLVDPRRDTTRPAYGYMNVVGPDGGDFYSVMVKLSSPDAYYTKTCPGDPPIVTKEPFRAGYLLRILWRKNTYKDGHIIFKGEQSHDEGDPRDFLNLLPPGASEHIPPEALEKLRQASGDGTSRRYTWEWELVGLAP